MYIVGGKRQRGGLGVNPMCVCLECTYYYLDPYDRQRLIVSFGTSKQTQTQTTCLLFNAEIDSQGIGIALVA